MTSHAVTRFCYADRAGCCLQAQSIPSMLPCLSCCVIRGGLQYGENETAAQWYTIQRQQALKSTHLGTAGTIGHALMCHTRALFDYLVQLTLKTCQDPAKTSHNHSMVPVTSAPLAAIHMTSNDVHTCVQQFYRAPTPQVTRPHA